MREAGDAGDALRGCLKVPFKRGFEPKALLRFVFFWHKKAKERMEGKKQRKARWKGRM